MNDYSQNYYNSEHRGRYDHGHDSYVPGQAAEAVRWMYKTIVSDVTVDKVRTRTYASGVIKRTPA